LIAMDVFRLLTKNSWLVAIATSNIGVIEQDQAMGDEKSPENMADN